MGFSDKAEQVSTKGLLVKFWQSIAFTGVQQVGLAAEDAQNACDDSTTVRGKWLSWGNFCHIDPACILEARICCPAGRVCSGLWLLGAMPPCEDSIAFKRMRAGTGRHQAAFQRR